ncbi:efflux RND transporter periplasmic adaptor subunit [Thalassolituus sp.]|uniref:efflux RND transporter periplasmic adaptor subunit n=1 Tax=Thalassolituus sp. TaxID=2030822 RepID=UPI0035152799
MSNAMKLSFSHKVALAILLVLVIWVVTGPAHTEDVADRPLSREELSLTVAYKVLEPETKEHSVKVSAHVAANRAVDVIAEVSGKVTGLPAKKGTQVKEGRLLLEIDPRNLPARLKQAEAQLKRRKLETQSTRNLFERELTNQSAVVIAESELAEAESELTAIRLDLDATQVRAPFDGIYDQRYVEEGEYVTPGTALVRVIDNQTMLVKGALSEKAVGQVQVGSKAYAELPNGTTVNGTIRFIAASASADTRTYEAEMEVTDTTKGLYDGQTATLKIPQGKRDAYEISPALLIITEDGGLGIKLLDEDNRVNIVSVDILEASTNGIWVYGPTGPIRLITVGQGFVDVGQQVDAKEQNGQKDKKADAE